VCTILIVDDDVDTRETLADCLRDQGHSVWLAMNGSHALELLELGRSMGADPCFALVDLRMPVMDGWALLAALDRDGAWRKLQVIVSSATDVSERPLSFAHAVVVWPKPIDSDKLARIQHLCPVHSSVALNPVASVDAAIAAMEKPVGRSRVVAPGRTRPHVRLRLETHGARGTASRRAEKGASRHKATNKRKRRIHKSRASK
jgi:CheY-like chemotaxis protein